MSHTRYTQAGSLDYKDAGRRVRLARQRLQESKAEISDGQRSFRLASSARAWRVFAVCAERTASWSKGSDSVHVRTIAKEAGLPENKVSVILKAFDAGGIFSWVKDDGRYSQGLLSLPSFAAPDPLAGPEEKRREKKVPPEEQCTIYREPKHLEIKCGKRIMGGDGDWADVCEEHARSYGWQPDS
jgi:hypothetical protein